MTETLAATADAIGEAQESLGNALGLARAGEDRGLAAMVRETGERLVRLTQGTLRLTRTHAQDNNAFEQPIAELVATLQAMSDLLGTINLVVVEDLVYLNDIRIRMDGDSSTIGADLRRHGVGGISFHQPLDATAWRTLVAMVGAAPEATKPRQALQQKLITEGLPHVELLGIFRFQTANEAGRDPLGVAARAVAVLESSCENLAQDRLPNPLPVRRLVAEILGAGSSTLDSGEPGASAYATHGYRVTQLALLIGHGLGLSDAYMQDLGVSAMFHDVGYSALEGATRTHPGYPPPFERHAIAGARLLLRQHGFHEAKIRRALCAVDHHLDFDDSGGAPSLFGRIVRIAEDFDNLVRPGGGALSPAVALGQMQVGACTRYDPTLFQLFVNAVGRYPPGTKLELADGTHVVVTSFARTPETWAQPTVVVTRGVHGVSRVGVKLDLARGAVVKRIVTE
jgi:HD-GYP domain-containing protein (c-di-GMP phosphodiesterase class II)